MDALLKKLEELNAKLETAAGKDAETIKSLLSDIKSLQEDYVKMKAEVETVKVIKNAKSLPGVEFEKEKFSLMRAINAIATKSWAGAPFEKEVFQNTSKDHINKTMSTEVDSAGGYIVPAQLLGDFIELLRANLVTKALGATVIDGLIGSPVEMPGQSGGATVYWLGEDNPTGITASDLTLRQSQMTPHMAAALVKVSNRLLRMSNPSVEALIRQDVAFAMAEAVDVAALAGTGAGAQPLGLKNIPGILAIDATSDPDVNKFVDIWKLFYAMEEKLALANSLKGKLGFAFNPRVKKYAALSRTGAVAEDGFGGFVANPSVPLTQSQLQAFIGYPYQMTTNIPIDTASTPDDTYAVFGNWSELILGVWQGITIMASQEASDAFAKNQTWVRIVQEVDCMVRHKESFVIASKIDATLTV
jgi:HK97 family phage major capsid protein